MTQTVSTSTVCTVDTSTEAQGHTQYRNKHHGSTGDRGMGKAGYKEVSKGENVKSKTLDGRVV
jgi:hypothetical protein